MLNVLFNYSIISSVIQLRLLSTSGWMGSTAICTALIAAEQTFSRAGESGECGITQRHFIHHWVLYSQGAVTRETPLVSTFIQVKSTMTTPARRVCSSTSTKKPPKKSICNVPVYRHILKVYSCRILSKDQCHSHCITITALSPGSGSYTSDKNLSLSLKWTPVSIPSKGQCTSSHVQSYSKNTSSVGIEEMWHEVW